MIKKIVSNNRILTAVSDTGDNLFLDWFATNVDELSSFFVGTSWLGKDGNIYTVSKVYIDRYHGGYCVEYSNTYGWNHLQDLLNNAILQEIL